MNKSTRNTERREESLSRESIIEAAIVLLDRGGESGLTFRALSEQLATGSGAIYWHIANKSELLSAACDAIVAQALDSKMVSATPEATIRAFALSLFEAIDEHPWVGSALTHSPTQLPMVRILERIGQQIRALGVPDDAQWTTVSALLNYIFGVGGQNAANAQYAQAHSLDRTDFLDEVATVWSKLDADEYPFTRSVAGQLRAHNDRVDFLAGIDLILSGIKLQRVG